MSFSQLNVAELEAGIIESLSGVQLPNDFEEDCDMMSTSGSPVNMERRKEKGEEEEVDEFQGSSSSERVVGARACQNPLLDGLLDSSKYVPRPEDYKPFKRLEDALLNELNESSYGDTTKMLLNYDKSRYLAIPVDEHNYSVSTDPPPSSFGSCQSLSQVSSPVLHPITIIGYNYLNTSKSHVVCEQKQQIHPGMNEEQVNMIFLKCNEVMPKEQPRENSGKVVIRSQGPHPCKYCEQKFFTKEYLHCHMIKLHSSSMAQKNPKKKNQHRRNEKQPLLTSTPIPKLKGAISKNRGSSGGSSSCCSFRCQLCPKSYSYLRNLKKHEEAHHSQANSNLTSSSSSESFINCVIYSYQCRICRHYFPEEQSLALHMKLHASTCQICFKVFGTTRGLKLHSVIHFGDMDKPYGCNVCDKRYSHARSLKHHMKSHSSESLSMEAKPQDQSELDEEGAQGSGDHVGDESHELDFVSYTFGAVESTL